MAEERPRPRRRRRRGRRGGGTGGVAAAEREAPAQAALPDWQWRTFPVFFAFAAGALVMGFLIGLMPGLYVIFFSVALFGVAFGLARIVTRRFVAGRR